MEKTVVEWLHNELKNLIRHSELTDMKPSFFDEKETEIIEQAKQMENNQRLEDFKEGFHSAFESLESANKLVQSRTFKSE